jgi:hypothetical protein
VSREDSTDAEPAEPNATQATTDSTPDPESSSPAAPPGEDHLLDENLRTFPWLRSLGVALAAFLLQYALVAATFLLGPASISGGSLVAKAKLYGFILFNAHHVTIVTQAANAQIAGPPAVNILYGQSGTAVPVILYFLLPVVVLAGAGAVLAASREGERVANLREEFALVVTGLASGYLITSVVVRSLVTRTQPLDSVEGVATAAPSFFLTLILMLAFSVICGGIGAALTMAWQERTADGESA